MTACGLFDDRTEPAPDPLAPLIAEALHLAAQHEAAIASYPELADRLGPIAQAHRAHAAELAKVTRVTLPSNTPTASASPATGDLRATLAALRTAEQQGQDSARQACVQAPEGRAALVGSIAAARATHVEVVR
ncbi:hypothetical protein [Micromonospora sonneratiae]|jgi:hypothetical protein|uniref:DUF4439 domain-containing protein n=1 Tax=Micromonospora sonneratiae TaxID=1184706 RepID=A0ABW3YQX2_9ACTN